MGCIYKMISTIFTLEELKVLEKAKWFTSAFHLEYGASDLEISTHPSSNDIWYYRTGDHMFKWIIPDANPTEIVEHLREITHHREVVLSG